MVPVGSPPWPLDPVPYRERMPGSDDDRTIHSERVRTRRRSSNHTQPSSDLVERIEAALRAMAPAWVRTGAGLTCAADEAELRPSERAAVASSVGTQRTEFATGKALLRRLIGDDVAIPIGTDRRPCLPIGMLGTLAHDRTIAVGR